MLNVNNVVKSIEDGLNIALKNERGNDHLQFRMHLGVGWESVDEEPENGKIVRQFIDCAVTEVATAPVGVYANIGALAFNIIFYVPLEEPKTEADQEIHDYDESEGAYPFYNTIYKLIQNYFLQPKIVEFKNTNSDILHYSYVAGVAEDTPNQQAKGVTVAVSGAYSDGDLSTEIEVLFDGERIPQQTVSPSTTGTKEASAESASIKAFLTSSAYPLSIDIPSRYDKMSKAVKSRLFSRTQNEPHFITIKWGENISHYFMIFENVTPATDGNNTPKFSCELVEATKITSFLNIPSEFKLQQKTFTTSDSRTVKITTSKNCYVYVNGNAYFLERGKEIRAKISRTDYELNANKEYMIGIIASDKTANITIDEV